VRFAFVLPPKLAAKAEGFKTIKPASG